jgi:multidrug resistance efflux pump
MLELMICSLVTMLPDYLYRRYAQGKRFGKEITFFSVWYELRWGITGCLMLTISLITMIFYFHPSTTSAAIYFRTVPILPEGSGRVAEVNVGFSQDVKKGDVLFCLDSSRQEAALETARRKVAEVDASLISARSDVVKAGPGRRGEGVLSASQGRARYQERIAAPQSRYRAAT